MQQRESKNLVNETNLIHNLFSVYLVNFIYKLYMFRTSPGPSSGEKNCIYATLLICYSVQLNVCYAFCIPESGPKHVEIINRIDGIH